MRRYIARAPIQIKATKWTLINFKKERSELLVLFNKHIAEFTNAIFMQHNQIGIERPAKKRETQHGSKCQAKKWKKNGLIGAHM